jgi:hypothetical protein
MTTELPRSTSSTNQGPLLTRAQYRICGQPVYFKAIRAAESRSRR